MGDFTVYYSIQMLINTKNKSFEEYKSNHEFDVNLIKSQRDKLLKENENLRKIEFERKSMTSSTINHSSVMSNRFLPKIIKLDNSKNENSSKSPDESYLEDLPEKLLSIDEIKENEIKIVSEKTPELLKVTKNHPKNFLLIWINFCFLLYLKYQFYD